MTEEERKHATQCLVEALDDADLDDLAEELREETKKIKLPRPPCPA